MAKKPVQNEELDNATGGELKGVLYEKDSVEQIAPVHGLVVVSSFELERNFQKVEYKEGDSFPLPEGWTRDAAFEEFRKINTKDNANGIAFSVPKPVLDEKGKLKYMDSRRVLLPLKEV